MARKKKKNLTLFVMLGLIVVLAVLYLVVNAVQNQKEEDKRAEAQELKLFSAAEPDITRMHVVNEHTELTLTKNAEGRWIKEGNAEFPLNEARAIAMASELTGLTAVAKVADQVENPAEFGFDDPIIVIEAESKSAGRVMFEVGGRSSMADSFYIRKNGSGAVYTVKSNVYYTFNKTDAQMMAVEKLEQAEGIRHILMTRKDQDTLEFVCDETGSGELRQPYAAPQPVEAERAAELVRFFRNFSFKESEGYASELSLAEYGLADPAAEITVTYTGDGQEKQRVLQVGGMTEDGDCCYVHLVESGRVYQMEKDTVQNMIGLDPFAYVDKQVFDPTAVTGPMAVVMAGKTQELDEAAAAPVKEALAKVVLERAIPEGAQTEGEAVLSLTFMSGDKQETLAFYPYDGKNFYVLEENGSKVFLVGLREADAVAAALEG